MSLIYRNQEEVNLLSYPKAEKYPDLNDIYTQTSGPGGLKLVEFIADKLDLKPGMRVLDIGTNRGLQTCFLAKEYGVNVVGIDPEDDRSDGKPHVDHLTRNAEAWGVANQVLGIRTGVPDTMLPANTFDAVYSTTTLEIMRGYEGENTFRDCLWEILRVLRPGGLFGYGDPMHLDASIPDDLAPLIPMEWRCCFVTLKSSTAAFQDVGFEILEAKYAQDSYLWWGEYAFYDPFCQADPEGEPKTIRVDRGRWLSYGYVISRKPE